VSQGRIEAADRVLESLDRDVVGLVVLLPLGVDRELVALPFLLPVHDDRPRVLLVGVDGSDRRIGCGRRAGVREDGLPAHHVDREARLHAVRVAVREHEARGRPDRKRPPRVVDALALFGVVAVSVRVLRSQRGELAVVARCEGGDLARRGLALRRGRVLGRARALLGRCHPRLARRLRARERVAGGLHVPHVRRPRVVERLRGRRDLTRVGRARIFERPRGRGDLAPRRVGLGSTSPRIHWGPAGGD
jgi:hypothetical protein